MPTITVDTIIKMPNSQKLAIVGGLTFAILASFFYFIYLPNRETLKARHDELSKLRAQYNEQQKVIADLPRFKKELKELQDRFEESLKMLPNSREIPSLLTNISNLAKECGLDIMLFQPKPEVPQDFYSEIPVEMKVVGKYHDYGYFFDKLSKLPRIVNVKDLVLDSKIDKTGALTLNGSFIAITFKFIEKKETGASKKQQKSRAK
ncbi:MAG: type 4a pilus biogenesis protein PilO [Desulfobacterota bacterium]|nr:type 4a pilus biogenesis protein PilO [Thermodesulfobacteriota bacterium]